MAPFKYLVSFLSALFFCSVAFSQAQDTLPKFSLRNVGNNRIIVGWINKYERVKQISIQRGFDSIGAYKTVLSVLDPSAQQNGFVDTKAPNPRMFYRLFIVFEGGNYLFTPSKRPFADTTVANKPTNVTDVKTDTAVAVAPKPTEPVVPKKPEWVPSVYVYTNKDGYVFINLPDAEQKKYNLKVMEENGEVLFELKNIKQTALTLDKANFYHSGWFNFELYNDEKLVEKNKFFLARVF
jgi:hypothetical protein